MAKDKNLFVALFASEFLSAVTHLGNTELGVYFRMILWYYAHERPLPSADVSVQRIAMALTPEEQRIAALMLEQFFEPSQERTSGGDTVRVWRHVRCDQEIAEAHARAAGAVKRGKGGAAGRWKANPAQSTLPGIAPPDDPPAPDTAGNAAPRHAYALRTHSVRIANQNKTLFILQNPATDRSDGDGAPPPLRRQGIETPAERLAAQLIDLGVTIAPGDPLLTQWLDAGNAEVDIVAAVRIARAYVKAPAPLSPTYVDRVLRTMHAARERAARGFRQRAPP